MSTINYRVTNSGLDLVHKHSFKPEIVSGPLLANNCTAIGVFSTPNCPWVYLHYRDLSDQRKVENLQPYSMLVPTLYRRTSIHSWSQSIWVPTIKPTDFSLAQVLAKCSCTQLLHTDTVTPRKRHLDQLFVSPAIIFDTAPDSFYISVSSSRWDARSCLWNVNCQNLKLTCSHWVKWVR